MMSKWLYVLGFIMVSLIPIDSIAIDPPRIDCVSLDSNNNLILNWSPPLDTEGVFTSYVIYYRDGAGNPFTSNTTINNYGQTQDTILGNFAGDAAFYMVSKFNGGLNESLPSDTVRPLLVSLTTDENEVEINWTDINLFSPDSTYRVYRSVNDGDWTFRGTADALVEKFVDRVEYCSADVEYRIEVRGRGGCESVSNIARTSVIDQKAPKQTNLFSASVDTATGGVHLAWDRTESGDGFGYLISHLLTVPNLDTLFGRDNLTYSYVSQPINAQLQTETLSVAPFDSCFDDQTMWFNQAADSLRFSTLFVDSIDFDRCLGYVALKWNMPKPGFPVGVRYPSEFQVFRKRDGGESEFRGAVSALDSIFIDSGLVKGSRYEYNIAVLDSVHLVRAISNTFTIRLKAPVIPEPIYISAIQNDHATGLNQVLILTDTTSETVKYGLYRSLFYDGPYQLVETSTKSKKVEFDIIDPTGDAGQVPYHYRVVAFDYCGDSIHTSLPAKSVWTNGYSIDQDFVNDLEWTSYFGFEHAESSTGVRQLVRLTSDSFLDTIPTRNLQFDRRDTVHNLSVIDGDICYYVEAIEPDTNKYGVKGISRSNLLCIDYEPKVFIPNAFTPDDDGINDVFLPDVNYIETSGYKLSIYDRKGNLIHITIDPAEGWSGEGSPIGTYAYFLELQNARNESVNYRGKVSLIR